MGAQSQITWMTLSGLSLLFVGGFVLWVYGAQKVHLIANADVLEDAPLRRVHTHLVHWFLLYGGLACFAGTGCLLTAAMMVV